VCCGKSVMFREGMCDMGECEVMWENVMLGVMWGHREVYTM